MKERGLVSDRRALSHHVEMMLSFVMFILFVFFVLLFVRPQENAYLSTSVVDGAHHFLYDAAALDVVTLFVDLSDVNSSCVRFDVPPELIDASRYDTSLAVRVVNSSVVDSAVSASTPARLGIKSGSGNSSYYVHLSDSFVNADLSSCNFALSYDLSLGSIRHERMLSYAALTVLRSRYLTDYEGLRSDLGIPALFDYAILVDDTLIMDIGAPTSVNVLAKDFIEPVLGTQGDVTIKRITIKLWR